MASAFRCNGISRLPFFSNDNEDRWILFFYFFKSCILLIKTRNYLSGSIFPWKIAEYQRWQKTNKQSIAKHETTIICLKVCPCIFSLTGAVMQRKLSLLSNICWNYYYQWTDQVMTQKPVVRLWFCIWLMGISEVHR